ncbi:terpenoid synthase [Aspergillus californicus]
MSIENTNPKALWRSIQHQQVQVPNLGRLFPSWKARIHPEYEKCRDEVLNPWIRHWVDNDRTCYKLQKAEFGVFAAILCAGSSFDRMCTVAKFFAWYFIWDDIFDCGSLQGDYITMKAYREASMQYIQHQLLPETECPDLSPYSQELQKALQCWEEVGSHIRSVCSSDTCIVLSKEIVDYIAAVDDANALFMDGTVPSVQEYWRRRDFTAGVYPTIATIPFAHGVDVNLSDISNPRMQDLWKSTSYLVHITNDILSLRKELKDGQIENIVPVLMLNKGLTMNQAIQESYNLANQNALGIDTATQALKSELPGYYDPVVNALTQGCTDIAAGLIHWR